MEHFAQEIYNEYEHEGGKLVPCSEILPKPCLFSKISAFLVIIKTG